MMSDVILRGGVKRNEKNVVNSAGDSNHAKLMHSEYFCCRQDTKPDSGSVADPGSASNPGSTARSGTGQTEKLHSALNQRL